MRFAGRVFYIFDYVYEPAEDTFLIAKHLKVDGFILDVGTGCGILSVLAASKAKHIVAVDINPYAARCAKINAEVNGVSDKIDILIGDLFNPIHENLTFDTILFNAPYLPDEKRKESKSLIEYAWSGGKDGREVIDRFIQQAPKYLKPYGRILLVQSSLSDVEKTIREFRKRRLQARIIDEEKIFFETISLIEALNLRKF
ncbi:methyltransferase [Candidatus Bathyarchaeota archaeon]|nr:MAG: methyltransferase [Candidatus Bathyarchaeota archaeon]